MTLHEEHEIHTQTQFHHHYQQYTQIPLPLTPLIATQKIQKNAQETHNQIPHCQRRRRTTQSKKKKLKPKSGAPTHLSHDLEVHMSHDLTWVQSNVVSRIPYHRRSFQSQGLVLLSFWCHKKKRWRALGQWEKRALGKRKRNEEGEETEKNQERDVTWWDKSYEWVPFSV